MDKKVRQRKEQRRDVYKSIQTLNLCSGHGQKFLTPADLEKPPSSQRRSIDEFYIQVRNAEGRAGAVVVLIANSVPSRKARETQHTADPFALPEEHEGKGRSTLARAGSRFAVRDREEKDRQR